MKKKLLVPAICILMMIIGGFATWAYLTDNDSAVNTFTVGKVAITLDEADTDEDSNKKDNKLYEKGLYKDTVRDKANQYHLIPGQTYVKDPAIHVDGNSEPCWLFATVKNDIAKIEKEDVSIAAQMADKGWYELKGENGTTVTKDNLTVYYYKGMAYAGQSICLFEEFTIDGDVATNTELAKYKTNDDKTSNIIQVTGYAIQAAGFETPAAAWDAANGQFK